MSITTDAGELDFSAPSQLQEIARVAKMVATAFNGLTRPSEVNKSVFEEYPHLTISKESDWVIDVAHFGTQIRFECALTFDERKQGVGLVTCSQLHKQADDRVATVLGSFVIDGRRRTNFTADQGHPITLPEDSDRIIAHYLQLAHQANSTPVNN